MKLLYKSSGRTLQKRCKHLGYFEAMTKKIIILFPIFKMGEILTCSVFSYLNIKISCIIIVHKIMLSAMFTKLQNNPIHGLPLPASCS